MDTVLTDVFATPAICLSVTGFDIGIEKYSWVTIKRQNHGSKRATSLGQNY
jgi:hypothetical protein